MKRLLLTAALASALTFVFCRVAGPHGQEITVFKAEQQAPVLETPAAPVVVPPPPVSYPPVRRVPTQRIHPTPLPKPKPKLHRPVPRPPLDIRPPICTGED